MTSTGHDGTMGADGLRARLPHDPASPQQATSSESAQAAVKKLNDEEEKTNKADHEKRTYGRTPDGKGMLNHTTTRLETYTTHPSISSDEVAALSLINCCPVEWLLACYHAALLIRDVQSLPFHRPMIWSRNSSAQRNQKTHPILLS